jgi:hypothetical protein
MRSQNGDFHSKQESAGMSRKLLDMRGLKKSKALTMDKESSLTNNNTAFCVLAMLCNREYFLFSSFSHTL